MKIGVISDTHRIERCIFKALDTLNRENVDVLFHLGDNVSDAEIIEKNTSKPVFYIKGNCDFNVSAPSERIEVIENKKILMTHGHLYNVKYTLNNLIYKGLEAEVDIVLFGHTHIGDIFFEQGIWFMNPGSAGMSRCGHNSVGVIEISNGQINSKIVPL
ncbi:metallophosphoesterase [Clostridium cellulovorans]|uniref:Phosphoesterase n=1 Tax=Clostridium cellulovorans (strain ATCC 35296 / DSM 3052 / OCM 3 / 743B) TaxID=573061 RepID=D9SVK9_CLOC7|nr:metallophosphoesterase [Clostridium cellulovorans]ADL51133.1 phosphodiesterase, MJ0936 family [Clostridium cellulovorans 743B]